MLVYYSVELSSNATLYMPIIQIIFVKKIIQYIRIFCKDVNEKNYTLQVMKECIYIHISMRSCSRMHIAHNADTALYLFIGLYRLHWHTITRISVSSHIPFLSPFW